MGVRAESEKLLSQTGEAVEKLSIPRIFGATDEDTDSLRIVSLYEVSLIWHVLSAPAADAKHW